MNFTQKAKILIYFFIASFGGNNDYLTPMKIGPTFPQCSCRSPELSVATMLSAAAATLKIMKTNIKARDTH